MVKGIPFSNRRSMTRGSAPMELDVALAKKCQRAPVIAWFLISSASFSIYFCITVENPTSRVSREELVRRGAVVCHGTNGTK